MTSNNTVMRKATNRNIHQRKITWMNRKLMDKKLNKKNLSNSIRKIFQFLIRLLLRANSMSWLTHKLNFLMSWFLKTIKTLKSKDLTLKNMMSSDSLFPKRNNIKSFIQLEMKVSLTSSITFLTSPHQFMILISSLMN